MEKKISFYFDEMMLSAVAEQLAQHNIQVIMAKDVEMNQKDDLAEHLPYASERNLILVTRDNPFASKAGTYEHTGLICWTGADNDIGGMVTALSEFAELYEGEDIRNQVFWIK
jgi:predicted nuclease of predicted toxin-antitoxin system